MNICTVLNEVNIILQALIKCWFLILSLFQLRSELDSFQIHGVDAVALQRLTTCRFLNNAVSFEIT